MQLVIRDKATIAAAMRADVLRECPDADLGPDTEGGRLLDAMAESLAARWERLAREVTR